MSKIRDIKPRWAEGLPETPPWRSLGDSVLVDTPWMRVTRHPAVAPTGADADYVVVRPKNVGTGVLPLHDDGTVTLVGQHRFALMRYSWEMPEGGAPEGEDPFEAVKRELAEEAGLTAAHWRAALDVDLSNSITDERAMTWVAWGLSATETAPDETEVFLSARVPFGELMAEIARGAVRDALTVATAYRAYHMAREGKLPAALARSMLGA
ncbi:NUDIX domain-containing protein [Brevundimonas naejangsanensis]|uniref:NUDIX domain-containing protein n=1 Tax=Brevundimonas naejangsanensis TaxID=588932 RepID=UPI000EBF5E22|nr:NUDIX hydrolase [Brevundimonas naejangsanensis]HAC01949.1 DNA mismatch repair protein MutT [Brevundimonas sp.]